jgi:chorismate mutase
MVLVALPYSVASAIAANFPNKIAKITGKFENVDKAKVQGVLCQHQLIGPDVAVLFEWL